MHRHLLWTVASLLGTLGFAHAQQFAPKPIDPTPIGSVTPALLPPAISPIVPVSARASQAGCAACAGPVVAYGEGCAAPGAHHTRAKSHAGKLFIGGGTANPVTCGCFASERTFIFGSCRQFYNPQHECGRGCWPVDRRPPGDGVTSYLNR